MEFLLITRYGIEVVISVLLLSLVVILISIFFIKIDFIKYALIVLSSALLIFTVYFFRDPDRITPKGENLIISPADGKVIQIKDVYEDKYLKTDCTQISIFMSPLNVHVNRVAIDGTVEYFEHIPGKYMVAFAEKSSTLNERTLIGINNGKQKLLFKQIAGFIARRIVADLKVGMKVKAGERFGMIKFGSRVDVLIPKKSAIRIKLNENVRAGETILAEMPNG
jgi:phosphatidylserine decarboxylase